ncbi:Imm8 family immunity protein [Actinoplanes sp. NPDC000266]
MDRRETQVARDVDRFLRKLIGNIEERDWNEAAAKLGRLAHHEFEDYTH